jgi:CheY-like chemotaxis protein
MKVLVADDDADFREVLVEFLNLHGFDIVEASNGLETLLQVKRQVPDAVLLDLRMPRLGGIDALKRILAFNAAINVVVVTAEVEPELHRQALAMGARAVLGKPVDLPAMLVALRGGALETAPTAPAAIGGVAVAADAPAAGAMPRVLVVDDDPDIRETLSEFLTRRNYRAATADDGAGALRMIVETPPDFVLLDIDMPGLKGTDALPAIRAVAPRAIVIMVSGTADTELAKRALALGAFDFVVKPVDWEYLMRSLETATTMRALEPDA